MSAVPMLALLPRLLAVFLLVSSVSALAYDPCPVCGGRVVIVDKLKDDLSKPSRNIEIWNRSMCANLLLGGALACTRCWMCSYWFEEKWKRMSEVPDSFIPPLSKAVHDFPVAADEASYSREFEGTTLTDSLLVAWDESKYAGYREYCKKHDLVMGLRGGTAHDILKYIPITGEGRPNPSEMGFTEMVSLVVTTKPRVLYEKALPPKRPVELRTAKSEYLRAGEALRTRYINELLQMMKKADSANDDLAEGTLGRELKTLALSKDSDTKELTKLLIGKWKSNNGYSPICRRESSWNWGLEEDKSDSAAWHIEGNELVETYPKRDDSDEVTTRRYPILLLNKTQFLCLEENEFDGFVMRKVLSWERIPEAKRR